MSNRRKQDKPNSAYRAIEEILDIEEILEENSCLKDLETLTRLGCDRSWIFAQLRALRVGQQISDSKEKSWESLTGMSRRSLRATVGRWRRSALEIERFNRSLLGYFLSLESQDKYFHSAPRLIRRCADTVGRHLAFSGPKKRPLLNSFKASLVAYV
jgi:hypothetical protein